MFGCKCFVGFLGGSAAQFTSINLGFFFSMCSPFHHTTYAVKLSDSGRNGGEQSVYIPRDASRLFLNILPFLNEEEMPLLRAFRPDGSGAFGLPELFERAGFMAFRDKLRIGYNHKEDAQAGFVE